MRSLDTPSLKTPIRTLHHLSCTGGTLITKCLAAMGKVKVINEVDPLSPIKLMGKPQFAPTDLILLIRQTWPEIPQSTLVDIFLDGLGRIYGEFEGMNEALLLRDHSHSHFLTGPEIPNRPSLLEMVAERFPTLSVVTVRDPVDSFLSMQISRWLQFEPASFDEYCRRSLVFLDHYGHLPIFKYEAFVASPQKLMAEICLALELPYTDDFIHNFVNFKFTGDSGRSGEKIEARPRRPISEEFLQAASDSAHYPVLLERLGYESVNGVASFQRLEKTEA